MGDQLCYEDVKEGMEIPLLFKRTSIVLAAKFACVSGQWEPIHYDADSARREGLPGVIMHGDLLRAFLGQVITDWIGDGGTIRKIGGAQKKLCFPDEDLICMGRVINKYETDNEHYIDCRIWVENTNGENKLEGAALIVLPSRI